MKAMKDKALRLMLIKVRASKNDEYLILLLLLLYYVIMNDDRSWMLPPWRA